MAAAKRGNLIDITGQMAVFPPAGMAHCSHLGLAIACCPSNPNRNPRVCLAAAKFSPACAAAPLQRLRVRRNVGAAAASNYWHNHSTAMHCQSQCVSSDLAHVLESRLIAHWYANKHVHRNLENLIKLSSHADKHLICVNCIRVSWLSPAQNNTPVNLRLNPVFSIYTASLGSGSMSAV